MSLGKKLKMVGWADRRNKTTKKWEEGREKIDTAQLGGIVMLVLKKGASCR